MSLRFALALLLSAFSLRAAPAGPGRWAGRTVVITGASSGLGRGVALAFGREGAQVVLAARRAAVLEEVAREIRASGGSALVVPTDVSQALAVARLGRAAAARFGRIDVWINNAAIVGVGRFWDIPEADDSKLVDTNLKGVLYGSKAALRHFRAQRAGVLINIGSVESELPLAYQATYAATKAGVLSLGRTLNEELRLNGYPRIHVATVMPWATDTPFWQHAVNYSGHAVRIPSLDAPEEAVRTVVHTAAHPREEVAVGLKGKFACFAHRLAPDFTERMGANAMQKEQMERAPAAPVTTGALYRPMAAGQGVSGGLRERMRAEEAASRPSR